MRLLTCCFSGCHLYGLKARVSKPGLVFGTAGSTTKGGCPILCVLCKGWDTRSPVRGIPPFAKSAKDGAPGDLLRFLPRTRNAPFHIPRVGNAGGRLYEQLLCTKTMTQETSNLHFGKPTHPARDRLLTTARSTKVMLRTPSWMPGTMSLSCAATSLKRERTATAKSR